MFPGRRWHTRARVALLALLVCGSSRTAAAQSEEFWPEIDVWLKVSPTWRASVFVPVSKNVETHYREGNLILQADVAWGKTRHERRLLDENRAQSMRAFLVRSGLLTGRSLGDGGEAYQERTAFNEFHVRLPFRGGILLSHRLRNDLRWLGSSADLSTRWRYRLMVEREHTAGRVSIVPYVNVEPYYDSRYETVNRTRVTGGATVVWSARAALEANWTYQYDSRSSVTHLNALNVILHVFFETAGARPASDRRAGPRQP